MEQTGQLQQYLLSILVKNRVGVLSRISGLIERRGYNIESITAVPIRVGENQTRITLVVVGDPAVVEHVIRQISNLEDIVRVDKLVEEENYCMELLLVRIGVTPDNRRRAREIADIYGAQVLHQTEEELGLQVSGVPKRIDVFLDRMAEFPLLEMSRTGITAMAKK